MTREQLLEAIKQLSREIDAASNRTDRDAARMSRDPDTQAETDRRIRESARELADLRARKDALCEQLDKLPAPQQRHVEYSPLAYRMGWDRE